MLVVGLTEPARGWGRLAPTGVLSSEPSRCTDFRLVADDDLGGFGGFSRSGHGSGRGAGDFGP
jgi:hypothetical protein